MSADISAPTTESQQRRHWTGLARSISVALVGDNQRKAKPTPADREAAARLKALWDARPNKKDLTQERMGEILGMNQSSVHQYINGKIPLNYRTCLGFARALGVDVRRIRTDLKELAFAGPPEPRQAIQALPPTDPDQRDSVALRADLDALAHGLKGLIAALTVRQPAVGESFCDYLRHPSPYSSSPILAELLAATETTLRLAPAIARAAPPSRKKARR